MTIVATREQMHSVADRLADQAAVPPADLNDYSPAIRQALLTISEGMPLEAAKAELEKLYDEWEKDGFQVEDYDEDEDFDEGDDDALGADPDAEPDPEHAPE